MGTSIDIEIVKKRLQYYKHSIKNDLSELISINSERDLTANKKNAPFGRGIRECFNKMIHFAQREGLLVEDFDGYAMHIEYGEGDEILGILGHLDIVGIRDRECWTSHPFKLVENNGHWYGRGVNDNKGPLMGCLYILKILKELNYQPNKKIRLIMGGAEETTWECMAHYFKTNPMPVYGFSPDGNFPIVNCEKGIGYYQYMREMKMEQKGIFNIISVKSEKDITRVCSHVEIFITTKHPQKLKNLLPSNVVTSIHEKSVSLCYKGRSAMGRNPQKGDNALFKFVKDFRKINGLDSRAQGLICFLNDFFIDSIHGEKLGLYYNDVKTGYTTSNLSYVILENDALNISFDYRYPKGINYETIKAKLKKIGLENNLELVTTKEMPLLYVSEDDPLVKALKKSYESIIGEKAKVFSKGATSYARALKRAVAFGPTFPSDVSNAHKPNECIHIDRFMKALLIYTKAIQLLT